MMPLISAPLETSERVQLVEQDKNGPSSNISINLLLCSVRPVLEKTSLHAQTEALIVVALPVERAILVRGPSPEFLERVKFTRFVES